MSKYYFNTSGPNIPDEHYTLKRQEIVEKGMALVAKRRYFTIWAPRQTGKSTYFRFMAKELIKKGYKVTHINLENYKNSTLEDFMDYLLGRLIRDWQIKIKASSFEQLQKSIEDTEKNIKAVLIIDEIEGLNPALFNQFLHTIRNLYHFRENHCLKSVILVGVSNIVGVIQDNASPFNIADNLEVPYFTNEETFRLLEMHEKETGQIFEFKVKEKISEITANQPGLVNSFAYQLVERFPLKNPIDYADYLFVEDWFLTEAIDKNISNIINKAKQYRSFVEKLLFTEDKEKFKINDEKIKFLHSHGLIKKDSRGNVDFWVPIYRKAVYDAFYPYLNGENKELMREINLGYYFLEEGKLNFDKLIEGFRKYIKRRGFRYFREKDEKGNWKNIKEAAIVYSFESFIQLLLQEVEATSYLEPHTGMGNSDLVINHEGKETVLEFKIYHSPGRFKKGKKQLAYYCKSLSLSEGIYLVFVPTHYKEMELADKVETIGELMIRSYIIWYDEEKDF